MEVAKTFVLVGDLKRGARLAGIADESRDIKTALSLPYPPFLIEFFISNLLVISFSSFQSLVIS